MPEMVIRDFPVPQVRQDKDNRLAGFVRSAERIFTLAAYNRGTAGGRIA